MSTAVPIDELDYPESDGRPMGETDWHINAIFTLRELLKRHYREQHVYVGSDLVLHYVEGDPSRHIAPDVFVVLDCDPRERSSFKIWEEKRVPNVVIEVTSKSTCREDEYTKPNIYTQIGVEEMFLFDPTGKFLKKPLQGFRFEGEERIKIIERNGRLHSSVLNMDLCLGPNGLFLIDCETGKRLLTGEEDERLAKELERQAKEFERQRRIEVEAENRELKLELERLRKSLGNS
jgi:Uma2 family endonuclease